MNTLTLLQPGGFWGKISLRAAGLNIMIFTILDGVVEEEHPYKFSDISNNQA